MKIISFRTNHGPNVFHSSPTLVMTIDLEKYNDVASTEIPGFIQNLTELLPGLGQHTCSPGYEGGFLERLSRGTYMAHIIEHVALEISSLCGIEVHYGKTRYGGRPGLYEIITCFKNEAGMKECLRQAVLTVKGLIEQTDLYLDFEKIRKVVSETALGPSGQALMDAAQRKNIPCRRVGTDSLLQLGYGKNTRYIQSAITSRTSLIAAEIAQDKNLTKAVLHENYIPVPRGGVVTSVEELEDILPEMAPPYVVKPLDGNHGRGVFLNLIEKEEILEAFQIAKKICSSVIVEEMIFGKDYRILVVDGKVSAAAERQPAHVVGDGKKTLQQLIDEVNQDPRRADGHNGMLTKIVVDENVLLNLKKKGIEDLDFVPPQNQKVLLRENANLSSGGTATDVTDKIHSDVRQLCERAARLIGLDICGIDLIHSDITQPVNNSTRVIEVNAGPGLRMHLKEGPRTVADDIVEMLYPEPQKSRIPIVAVTGTNGKTTVARMLHKILSDSNEGCVGLTTTEGIWVGEAKVVEGDTTGPQSCQLVLSDPKVSLAVLEVARGGLLRGGLAYDWSDVAVITNIQLDHIGQNGIEDIEDLVWIKSLVAERVKKNGTVVLNADDPNVLALRDNKHVQMQTPKIFLISKNASNPELKKHILAGGDACWLEGSWVVIQHRQKKDIVRVAEFPVTANGMAVFQIVNAMAGLAAALAIGTPQDKAIESLRQFSAGRENSGRFNIYRVGSGYVILDYGHNSAAFSAVGSMLDRLQDYKKSVVAGMPGDRSDLLIENGAGILAAHYDNFFLKEDRDLRGRQSGEVPEILKRTLLRHRSSVDVNIILNEAEAFRAALDRLGKDEILTVFYEDLRSIMSVLMEYNPRAVDHIPSLKETGIQEDDNHILTDKDLYHNAHPF